MNIAAGGLPASNTPNDKGEERPLHLPPDWLKYYVEGRDPTDYPSKKTFHKQKERWRKQNKLTRQQRPSYLPRPLYLPPDWLKYYKRARQDYPTRDAFRKQQLRWEKENSVQEPPPAQEPPAPPAQPPPLAQPPLAQSPLAQPVRQVEGMTPQSVLESCLNAMNTQNRDNPQSIERQQARALQSGETHAQQGLQSGETHARQALQELNRHSVSFLGTESHPVDQFADQFLGWLPSGPGENKPTQPYVPLAKHSNAPSSHADNTRNILGAIMRQFGQVAAGNFICEGFLDSDGRYLIPRQAWGALSLFIQFKEDFYKEIHPILAAYQPDDATVVPSAGTGGHRTFLRLAQLHARKVPLGFDDRETNGKSDFRNGVRNLQQELRRQWNEVDWL